MVAQYAETRQAEVEVGEAALAHVVALLFANHV